MADTERDAEDFIQHANQTKHKCPQCGGTRNLNVLLQCWAALSHVDDAGNLEVHSEGGYLAAVEPTSRSHVVRCQCGWQWTLYCEARLV